HPLRWRTRRKALLRLPEGVPFAPELDVHGLLAQVQLDLGQVISARPRALYPTADWETSANNALPKIIANELLIEYTAHADARFVLWNGETTPVSAVEGVQAEVALTPVPAATQRVRLRVTEGPGGPMVPCKLHVHGQAGEYLAPVDRHRMPNGAWFEDYSVDFTHAWRHHCTYITGEATIDLPLGTVYLEISKGFEIKPLRLAYEVTPETSEILVVLDKVLPWRQQGWVTADTHVHFLSPMSALLEGSAEGVNVVNLLASQWGELMTNVGDFDGRSTWGSREMGGDGEHLVRVGTENRQHVMGHISLLGYEGGIIAPMTSGGPDESALGDPVGALLTEWARQCREQGGLVVLPHFPHPRMENAATIVEGLVDGVEMTSWGDLYSGINPYSLSDWYRYLNNGYLVAAVGGTDKMSATTAVGTVRTYALLRAGEPLTYAAWMDAVRRAETFVTYGPLLDMSVDGQPMGGRIALGAGGGTVDVSWQVASVTVPMSRVELVVNGEIRESVAVDAWRGAGSWSLKVDRSSWAALLVRGHYADQPEIVAAHSSPVMLEVEGSAFYAAADAVTILEQIEGALAYLDTVGTRAEDRVYKRLRLVLEGAHRRLHNRMHAQGHYHEHTAGEDHAAH
ncbi:MAG: CehA/McbA family metallohydrolase, partial [Chloroflexi bacterium]|nr:CehA/McbA family metallohydrolase [Chloroflexota bacterium]